MRLENGLVVVGLLFAWFSTGRPVRVEDRFAREAPVQDKAVEASGLA